MAATTPLSQCPECDSNLRTMTNALIAYHDDIRLWDVLLVSMRCPECRDDEQMLVSSRMANHHADAEEQARREILHEADQIKGAI